MLKLFNLQFSIVFFRLKQFAGE